MPRLLDRLRASPRLALLALLLFALKLGTGGFNFGYWLPSHPGDLIDGHAGQR